MSLKSSENEQLFPKHQCNTGISFLLLFLVPNILSIDRQTNEERVGTDSENFLSFSRNEPLHLLLDADVVNDEEETLLSSIPRTRRRNISLIQCQSNSFFQWEQFLVKSQQVLFFVVLAFAFDRHAKSFAFSFCEIVGGVQGAFIFFAEVAQTCHDDRVVELKEQLVVEEVDGEWQEGKVKEEGRGRTKESAPWIWPWMTKSLLMTWAMRCAVSSSSVDQCALCARSTHDVHHAIFGVNVVIGVLVVHCELHVVRVDPIVVCDDVVSSSHTCSHSFSS